MSYTRPRVIRNGILCGKKNKPSDTVTVHRRVNIRPEQIVLTHSEPLFLSGSEGQWYRRQFFVSNYNITNTYLETLFWINLDKPGVEKVVFRLISRCVVGLTALLTPIIPSVAVYLGTNIKYIISLYF